MQGEDELGAAAVVVGVGAIVFEAIDAAAVEEAGVYKRVAVAVVAAAVDAVVGCVFRWSNSARVAAVAGTGTAARDVDCSIVAAAGAAIHVAAQGRNSVAAAIAAAAVAAAAAAVAASAFGAASNSALLAVETVYLAVGGLELQVAAYPAAVKHIEADAVAEVADVAVAMVVEAAVEEVAKAEVQAQLEAHQTKSYYNAVVVVAVEVAGHDLFGETAYYFVAGVVCDFAQAAATSRVVVRNARRRSRQSHRPRAVQAAGHTRSSSRCRRACSRQI